MSIPVQADGSVGNLAMGSESVAQGGSTEQLLTFVVNEQEYGVDILRVQEIRGWESVTRIPNTPEFVRGVLNLRGAIVPIVDLRNRLGLESVEYDKTTVIVVLQVQSASGSRVMGIVVDAVSDVCAVAQDSIQEAPEFGEHIDTRFVRGMATRGGSLVIILDVDQLLATEAGVGEALDGRQSEGLDQNGSECE